MNRIFLGLILMVVYIAPIESQELQFSFECEGKNSTMSSYSYVKEPTLSESGYTRGLKTGSFNYLEAGMIDLSETITYEYGNGTLVGNNSTNSSLTHTLNVNFDGRRGISEFYGKAFFNYGRAVSAWKKIRYEDLSRYENVTNPYNGRGVAYSISGDTTYTLGTARTSRNFSVDASTKMYSHSGWEYFTLNWETKAKDAVIETKDAAGWSNRTGMDRIDFEHDSLMSGEELNVTNHLEDSSPEPTEAGGGNWLTCCFSGTVPEIERNSGCECATDECPCNNYTNNGYWPDESVTYGTLSPDMKLPNTRLVRTCFVDAWGDIRCTEPKYEPISCSDLNCTDFDECMYGLGISNKTGITGAGDEKRKEFANLTSIQVHQRLSDKETVGDSTRVTYNITILNSGSVKLTNVTLYDTLPLNANYTGSSFVGGGEPVRLDLNLTKQGSNTLERVNLSLGAINSGETKVVRLRASHLGTGGVEYYKTNKVYVTGDTPFGFEVNKTAEAPSVPGEKKDVWTQIEYED